MKKISIFVCVVLALTILVTPVNAKKAGAEVKGPTVLYVGKTYNYQAFCSGLNTNYVEFGFISNVLSPRIVSGDGILYYEPDKYPGWFGWYGSKTNNLRFQFKIQPVSTGNYTVHFDCWGETEFDSVAVQITVISSPKR